MDIMPNIGIGSVRFGMTPSKVLALFPEEQKYEDWMGGNLNDSLLYHGLILGFDKCDSSGPLADSRFVEVRMSGREDATLWGKRLADWTKNEVIIYLDGTRLSYEIFDNGDLIVRPLNLCLSFNKEEHLDFVEMWSDMQKRLSVGNSIMRRVSKFLRGRA